jgi:hypothetical protein
VSAINVIRTSHSVSILSDGACYDDAGVLQAVGSKVVILPECSAAIGCRGVVQFIGAMRVAVLGLSDFDELLQTLPKLLRHAVGMLSAARLPDRGELTLIGWSRAREVFEHWLVASHGDYGQEVPAFQPVRRDEAIYAAPTPADFECPAAAEFNMRTHGLAMLEAQRRAPQPLPAGGTFCAVGGFAQVTTIDRTCIVTSIIHRWPDKPGMKICA